MLRTILAALTFLAGSSGAWAAGLEAGQTGILLPGGNRSTSSLRWSRRGSRSPVLLSSSSRPSSRPRFSFRRACHDWLAAGLQEFRANLGRGILLGLELLVAADIIGTVAVTPSFENLAILGLIVLIRTFLSFSSKSRSKDAGRGSGRRRNAFSRQHRIGLPEAL